MLKIDQLAVSYGSVTVLKDITLQVNSAEIRSVIGFNNSGKSTLFRVLTGLHRPAAGLIRFNNEDLIGLPPEEIVKRGLAMIPERRRLFSDMTVFENLLLGGYSLNNKKDISDGLETVYDLFPILQKRRGQISRTLSGGEQQMLAIGRGLMAKPVILLLDEPFLALAPLLIKQILEVLRRLSKEGMGILLAEQNAAQALKVSVYFYVLSRGRVVYEKDTEGVTTEMLYQHLYHS